MNINENEPGASPSNELAGLMLQADQLDGEQAAQAPEALQAAQEEAQAVTLADANRQGVAMILGVSVPILSKLYPSLAEVYTPEACEAVSASLGPVLAKYNVNLAEWGGKYQEEIGALFVCGPIAWATVQGVKADIAARAASKPLEHSKPSRPAEVVTAGGAALKPGDYGFQEAQDRALAAA
ncbi:hypothetical protein [Massilia sp. DD77]|uniref:hypothetical protein n=1 Tax=Massilia sp. DD77 TaxID=3109349 RepID=UPI002FFE2D65